ncbi:MAG: hypothetical protein COU33_00490 [Candidatus Magasanikbacteria bacterium CG10_big_fil_rev_8_21_14_0_10_43_6]|uniref:N-acetyltransferase domain-containing protein n=1 Tax=Candidatus Magasanikbacteria bacterium CG10_big_fil_rev_8_21_14_0_10_43_6 TaxID=1974650 RepID=A0A2M6W2B9_9BACT|nr:MAG: hypothetical protein COU33_00490 [Candidatus Magasanikbacteria bacterium CG10_big_fil_rev_8_21_14_0_10_43_6]
MKIENFSEEFLEEMAELFVEVYSKPGYEWNIDTAKSHLEQYYKFFPDFNLMALSDTGEIMGAIFCSIDPQYTSNVLFIDSLQVKDTFRKQQVGKKLFAVVANKAKEQGFSGIQLLADERFDFPKNWYEKLGFKKTNWVEYESSLSDMTMNVLD